MAVAVQGRALVPMEAPLPRVRTDDLLAVVPVNSLGDMGWRGGAASEGWPPGPAFTHDPCSEGSDRWKVAGGAIAAQESGLFTVYIPAFCTAQSVGRDPERFISRLRQVFAVYERAAVERMLVDADGHTELGGYLTDDNLEILDDDVVDAVGALQMLETAIARHSAGVIHATPSTVIAWDALNLTVVRDGLTYTRRGTPIAVGPGYIDARPVGADPLEERQQWAFASGPIEVLRADDIDVPADTIDQILDRSMNDVFVIAERAYLFNWVARQAPDDPDHVQAGVLVDETVSGNHILLES